MYRTYGTLYILHTIILTVIVRITTGALCTAGVVMISGYSKQSSLVVSTCSVDGSESVSSETETASLKDCFHLIMDEDIRELEVQIFDEEETDIDSFPATVDEPGSHEYNTLSRETGFRGPRSLDEDGYMDVFHPSATTDRQEPFEEYVVLIKHIL